MFILVTIVSHYLKTFNAIVTSEAVNEPNQWRNTEMQLFSNSVPPQLYDVYV